MSLCTFLAKCLLALNVSACPLPVPVVNTGWRHMANRSHVASVGTGLPSEVCRKDCAQLKREGESVLGSSEEERDTNQERRTQLFFQTLFFYFYRESFWSDCNKLSRHRHFWLFWRGSKLKLWVKWMWKKRAKVLTQSRRNVSNEQPASLEMSSLRSVGRPAPPQCPGPERVWWVSRLFPSRLSSSFSAGCTHSAVHPNMREFSDVTCQAWREIFAGTFIVYLQWLYCHFIPL